MKHILLSALLWCCSFTLHAEDNGSLLFSGLLPGPQQISLIEQVEGIDPQTIRGFCLKRKTEIPFAQTYFSTQLYSTLEAGTICLELTKAIKHREGYTH